MKNWKGRASMGGNSRRHGKSHADKPRTSKKVLRSQRLKQKRRQFSSDVHLTAAELDAAKSL